MLGATLCSGATVYGYTGEDVSGGLDTQFVITANTICNNDGSPGTCTGGLEGGSSFPFDSSLLTTNSVSTDGYATLTLPDPPTAGGSASWVGPQANQVAGSSGGPMNGSDCCIGTTTYTVTFSLTGFDLSDAVDLELLLAGDDTVSVTLNGHAITLSGTPTYNGITTTSGINVSTDSLTATGDKLVFVVDNSGGGPTGLDAFYEFSGTNSPATAPEPMTFALTGLGLAGLGALRLRRRA